MFIRLYSGQGLKRRELLVNLNHVSQIEVTYCISMGDDQYNAILVDEGMENPNAIRCYKFSVGGEEHRIIADVESNVANALSKFYDDAIKD